MDGRGLLSYVAQLANNTSADPDEALAGVGLGGAGKRRIKTYSLGMRQRLGVATALINRPQNLILDEPINGLDVAAVRWMRDYLRGVCAEGRCVLLSSHILSELELVADRVVLLHGGRIQQAGTVRELRRATDNVLVQCPDPPEVQRRLAAVGLLAEPDLVNARLRIVGREISEIAQALLSTGCAFEGIWIERQSIEDLYLSIDADPVPNHPEQTMKPTPMAGVN